MVEAEEGPGSILETGYQAGIVFYVLFSKCKQKQVDSPRLLY